jgi:hypothetical protein
MGLNLKDEKKIKDAEIEKYFVILWCKHVLIFF